MLIVHCIGNFLLATSENQQRSEINWKKGFTLGPILASKIRLAIAVVLEPLIIYYSLYPMVLTKCILLFGLSVSLSKNICIFKCECSSGANNLNLHLEIVFF